MLLSEAQNSKKRPETWARSEDELNPLRKVQTGEEKNPGKEL